MKRLPVFSWLFIGCFILLLVGCGPSLGSPTPTPTPFPTCIPAASPFKFFSSTDGVLGSQNQEADKIAGDIYVKSLSAKAANDIAALERQKSRALQFLAYETMRWSSAYDIEPEAGKRIRLVVTFISPELIRAVILNHVMYKNENIPGLNLSAYSSERLQNMDVRQEFLFLTIVQAELPEGSEIQIELPATSFFLKKNADVRVPVSHTDGFFRHSLKMSSSQHTGFLYFPFGVSRPTQTCQQTLDTLHDKSILLSVEGAVIGDKKYDEITWQIPFVPPIDVGSAIPTPNPDLPIPSGHAPASIAPSIQNIGVTGMVTALTEENREYWSKLGQFVWSNLTLDYFPPSQ